MTVYNLFEIVKTKFPNLNAKLFVVNYNNVLKNITSSHADIITKTMDVTTIAGQSKYLYDKTDSNSGSSDIDMTMINKVRKVQMIDSDGYPITLGRIDTNLGDV